MGSPAHCDVRLPPGLEATCILMRGTWVHSGAEGAAPRSPPTAMCACFLRRERRALSLLLSMRRIFFISPGGSVGSKWACGPAGPSFPCVKSDGDLEQALHA